MINNICAPVEDVDWEEVKRHCMHLLDVPVESFGDGTVDVLLGLDAVALMAAVEVRRGHNSEPYAELTPLGWVIASPVSIASGPGKCVLNVEVDKSENDVSCQLRTFWEVDSFCVPVETVPLYKHSD